jgi:hypothetical protein
MAHNSAGRKTRLRANNGSSGCVHQFASPPKNYCSDIGMDLRRASRGFIKAALEDNSKY